MAPPADVSELQRRYEAVEKAYCQGRWATVLEAGTTLLRETAEARETPEVAGLHHRMQLLMAHTLLHGYGDRDAAEDLYELVRQSDAESSLRQMAEDGLDQCHQPLTSSFAEEEPPNDEEALERPELFLPETERPDPQEPAKPAKRILDDSIAPEPGPEPPGPEVLEESFRPVRAERGMAADPFRPAEDKDAPKPARKRRGLEMPWLTPLPEDPAEDEGENDDEDLPPVLRGRAPRPRPEESALVPDVVEEPELLEVHQATPSLAEEVDLEVMAKGTPLSEDDALDLRSCLLRVVVNAAV